MPRHFLDLPDLPAATLKGIIDEARRLKGLKYAPPQLFDGLSLAMVFDKRSTRTRMSFEVAMKQLGGHTIVMDMSEMQLTGSESIEDTGAVLSRYVDGIMIRMSDHATLLDLSRHTTIPVINGMTNFSHPCQIMADILTVEEKLGSAGGKKVAWLGDFSNVARSWAHAASIWDFDLVCAMPESLLEKHKESFDNVRFTADPTEAAGGANVVVTDTWVSMGQEGKDIKAFWPYQVNADLMANAADGAIMMHCMPVHRGEEATNEVLASPACVIYDEAENRLHAQKAILAWCLQDSGVRIG
ncbi:MAG: ornithine carbamoyltransferase [Alphaproteobacteria bacterium]|nr:ornithine carbamoyltransferase [Alphaproteobacteria bacterium]